MPNIRHYPLIIYGARGLRNVSLYLIFFFTGDLFVKSIRRISHWKSRRKSYKYHASNSVNSVCNLIQKHSVQQWR